MPSPLRLRFPRLTLSALLTSLILMMAACSPSPEPAEAVDDVVDTSAEAADGFVLLETRSVDYRDRPALQLRFSRPLVTDQNFDALLLLRDDKGADVSGSWVLDSEDTQRLTFPFVEGNKTYRLSVKAGLAATDGSQLDPIDGRDIYSGNLAPVVGFASHGSVLPARGSKGLPVISINTEEVDVEFFRVREKSLSDFLSRYAKPENRSYWELTQIGKLADSVYANRFALNANENQRQVSFLPINNIAELREAGVYFAVMRRAGNFNDGYETTYYYVTDLGLHARADKNSMFVLATSLASGEPRKNVELQLQGEKGEILSSTKTDAEGGATISVLPKSKQVLVARQGSEVALVSFSQPALDLSEFPVAGRKQTQQDVYAWSGRDLLRPGEVLQVSALLRDYDGHQLPKDQTLYATLRQPNGRAISTLPLEPDALAYYSYQRTLNDDAATGRWTLEYRLDPSDSALVGKFEFRVEEFLPERLKLALDSASEQLAPGEALPLSVDADYLYGAPASGNRFMAEMLYRPMVHPVSTLKDWFFGDPTISLPKEPAEVIDGKLDDNGRLSRELPVLPDAEQIPEAPFEVIVSGSVFESGGRAVRRSIARSVWPANELVGVRPLFDPEDGPGSRSDARFEIIKSDADGNYHAATGLQVRLIRELRDYHWSWVDGSGWNTSFTRRYLTEAETRLDFDGSKPAQFSARVEWGEYRLEIIDPATGLVTRYPFVAGWSWNNQNQGLDARPDKVKIAFDNSTHQVGDKASISITSPYDGPAVVLVESDQLLYRKHLQIRGTTTLDIPVDERFMRHDVYVSVVVFRPAEQANLVGPNRAIGIAHFPVANGQRNVTMELDVPEITRPGERIDILVSAPQFAGEEAWAVVDAVDLGIINLSGYPVPDASRYFLAQRGYGIALYDLFSRVIEPLEGERARLRYGGDAALAALPQARRPTAKVQTVALHHEPVRFDANGKATLSFTAPDFNGSLRVAALAYTAERYARSSEESIIRAPLVMEVSTPRVMAPGDRATLTVDLHNLSGKDGTYRVSATGNAPMSVEGQARDVTLANNARTTVSFPIVAGNGHGVGKFSVSAVSADNTLERDFELTIRPAWPPIRRSQAQQLPDATRMNFGPNLFHDLIPESAVAQINIASIPPLPFSESIKGLIEYPYGCIEQTTSRLWPLVNLDAATSRKLGLEPLDDAKRKNMLDVGFSHIASMQTENGRFSFWPGEGWTDPQMTTYVADLLITAKENGLAIPEQVLEKALKRLNEDLLTGGDGFYSYDQSDHLRFANNAYAAYVLARVNRAPLGTLRSLWDNQRERSLTALPLMQLGIALKLAGDESRAANAIKAALEKNSKRPRYLGDYGSDIRDEALLLALMYEHGLATADTGARVLALARTLLRPENINHWFSTQERLAIFRLGRGVLDESRAGLQGEFLIADKPHALSGRSLVSREVNIQELRRGVSLTLEGDGPFWLSQDVVGYPLTAPEPTDSGIRIRRAWYRTDGSLFEGDVLHEGESLIAMLIVESKEKIRDALVVDLLPGGLEVENLDLGANEAFGELTLDGVSVAEREYGASLRYEEYRDDRYVAALELWPGSTARLLYLVRAVSPGTYVVPPPNAEDMYRPDVYGIGTSTPAKIRVVPPDNK